MSLLPLVSRGQEDLLRGPRISALRKFWSPDTGPPAALGGCWSISRPNSSGPKGPGSAPIPAGSSRGTRGPALPPLPAPTSCTSAAMRVSDVMAAFRASSPGPSAGSRMPGCASGSSPGGGCGTAPPGGNALGLNISITGGNALGPSPRGSCGRAPPGRTVIIESSKRTLFLMSILL